MAGQRRLRQVQRHVPVCARRPKTISSTALFLSCSGAASSGASTKVRRCGRILGCRVRRIAFSATVGRITDSEKRKFEWLTEFPSTSLDSRPRRVLRPCPRFCARHRHAELKGSQQTALIIKGMLSNHGKSESELPFVNPIQIRMDMIAVPTLSNSSEATPTPKIAAMIRAWVNLSGSAVDRSSSFHRSVSINGARYYSPTL
jgi:hypothetical protein